MNNNAISSSVSESLPISDILPITETPQMVLKPFSAGKNTKKENQPVYQDDKCFKRFD